MNNNDHFLINIFILQVPIKMLRNGDLVKDLELLELSSFADGLELNILDEPFAVAFNLPWISLIELPTSVLATCYVYPSKIELQCSNPEETIFIWYKGMKVKLVRYTGI